MSRDQALLLAILVGTVGLFLWGRWRHDMVAVASLLACVLTGLVPARDAFSGFGHPAVITVACVLVLSRGLQTSGAVDLLTRALVPRQAGATLALAALLGLGALLSGFMNNVGVMALLMPAAVRLAGRVDLTPGQVLMPLAFATILGGMTTLVGTPPNLIVSGFRAQTGRGPFGMFDFAPVGLPVAAAGVVFLTLLGSRLVPRRRPAGAEDFEPGAYITEARVPEGSKADGMRLREVEAVLDEGGAQLLGVVRSGVHLTGLSPGRKLRAGDILVVEAEAEALADVLSTLGLRLEGTETTGTAAGRQGAVPEVAGGQDGEDQAAAARSGEVALVELVVLPGSSLIGRSARDILLRTRYGANLLALSREGHRSVKRLASLPMRSGDLLLLQGPPEAVFQFAADHGCVPLAERDLHIPDRRKAWTATAILLLAVGAAAVGVVPAPVSFTAGVLASAALRTVPPRAVYEAVDWPVIVLLAGLIPVAGAMQTTGTADLLAQLLLDHLARGDAVLSLALILLVSMVLSDVMNNAATAAVMCPIAIRTASVLGASPDPFLMAVAVGASCAFLTPIGHQNNTLILGPGGFRFQDYWKLGLPLEVLVTAVAVPLLLLVWPL